MNENKPNGHRIGHRSGFRMEEQTMRRMTMAKEHTPPDYNTPNKKKRFVEAECQRILKAVNAAAPDKEGYLGGIYGTRRQKAILSVLDRAEASSAKVKAARVTEVSPETTEITEIINQSKTTSAISKIKPSSLK